MEKRRSEAPEPHIDGKMFQHQLDELATTIAFKVQREGHKRLPSPIFVMPDIYYLLRQAQQTYNLFCFINADEIRAANLWPTLGRYLRLNDPALAAHQQFLKRFTYGFWQEYSGISHATFQGLLPIGKFLAPKDFPHELRPIVEDRVEDLIAVHISRVAAILLCTLTELQAFFKFDGARINERLHQVWNALLPAPEIKELYDERYAQLMREKDIDPNHR